MGLPRWPLARDSIEGFGCFDSHRLLIGRFVSIFKQQLEFVNEDRRLQLPGDQRSGSTDVREIVVQ